MFITCPVCGFTMSEYESVDNLKVLQQIQICHMCGSVWVSGKYIEQLLALSKIPEDIDIEKIFAEQDLLVKEGSRTCPECYRELEMAVKTYVTIEQCLSCWGILFDRTELKTFWEYHKYPNTLATVKPVLIPENDSFKKSEENTFKVMRTLSADIQTKIQNTTKTPSSQDNQENTDKTSKIHNLSNDEKDKRWEEFEEWCHQQLNRNKRI